MNRRSLAISLTLVFAVLTTESSVLAINMPFTTGSITVDGNLNDPAWADATSFGFFGAGNNGLVVAKMMWDESNAYFGFTATDTDLWTDDPIEKVWNDDSIEFYIDLHNDRGAAQGPDDVAFLLDVGGDHQTWGGSQWWNPDNVVFQSAINGTLNNSSDTDSGYTMEIQIPWTELITPYTGRQLGITFGTSDDDAGGDREAWAGPTGVDPAVPNTYLDLNLTGGPSNPVPMYSNANLTVKNYNMGDPAVVFHNGRYYMVESPHEQQNNQIIMYSSPNLADWDYEGVVYETPNTPGSWNEGFIFAPDISIVNNEFYIGYSAQPAGAVTGHRVGIVHSTTIDGTYTETSSGPLFDTGNMSIDSHIEQINGESYIYWTQFQGSQGLYVAKLNNDFSGLATSPQSIVSPGANEQLVEAPWTYEKNGTIYLFYSANPVDTENYRVGYATSTSPTGPFTKQGHILVKNTAVSGPGHNSIVESPDGKETFIVYHKWVDPDWTPGEFFQRDIAIDRLFFREDGSVFTFGPTIDDHPLPSGVDGSFGVFQIKNPGLESNSLAGWDVSSTSGSTSHIFAESNFDDNQNQEGQYHLAVFNAGPSKDALVSQVLTGLQAGATYRITAWTRNSGRDLTMGVTPEGGLEVSILADHISYGREELDFTVAFGSDMATIWFDTPAGFDSSWIWVDAVEVFKIADPTFLAADFNQDGSVNSVDQGLWAVNFGLNGNADADGDNDSDGSDFLIWQQQFGNSPSPLLAASSTAVPEPTTIALFATAAALSLTVRQRIPTC